MSQGVMPGVWGGQTGHMCPSCMDHRVCNGDSGKVWSWCAGWPNVNQI